MQRLVLIVFAVMWAGGGVVMAQHEKEMKDGYYVVVAAYAQSREDYAARLVAQLGKKGHDASYGYNSSRHFYFVYLKYFEKYDPSIANMLKTREAGLFTDAWVRIVKDAPVTSEEEATSSNTSVATSPAKVEATSTTPSKADTVEESAATETMESSDSLKETTPKPAPKPSDPAPPAALPVVLHLVYATVGKEVDGDVEIIDTDRSRLIEKDKGNAAIQLPDPSSGSGKLTLICDVFGYRKMQHDLDSFKPAMDTSLSFVTKTDSAYVINFDLVRYEKGDIATLYNVYFYNDAAVMRSESKYELNSLLQMMQENPKYRIKLHGHTNGQYRGKIYTVGPEKNYFSLTDARAGSGSAKALSNQRAQVIKDWLISQGIKADRIEVKAWGGKRPLYDKNGPNAEKNVRVEVEVLQD